MRCRLRKKEDRVWKYGSRKVGMGYKACSNDIGNKPYKDERKAKSEVNTLDRLVKNFEF